MFLSTKTGIAVLAAGLILAALLLAGCASDRAETAPTEAPAVMPSPTIVLPTATPEIAAPVAVTEPSPAPTATKVQTAATATAAPPSPTLAPTAVPTLVPKAIPTATAVVEPAAPARGPAIVIDHRSVDDFDRIPDEYIQKAAQLRLFLRHASVGQNLYDGLRCLANNFPDRRPNFCDRRLPPEQVLFDPKYNPNNWTFELHAPPPNPNPIWMEKVKGFIGRVNNPQPGEDFDAVALTFDYVDLQDNANMDEDFFNPASGRPGYQDIEALMAAHPDKTFVWWTSNLARGIGTPDSQNFNDRLRAYVAANGGVLFDMADIESHAPDGSPCVDNAGRNIPAICQDYTNEKQAGHLNALGSQRAAKTMWVLMARLAGWTG
jgi:hypothetical protein